MRSLGEAAMLDQAPGSFWEVPQPGWAGTAQAWDSLGPCASAT